MIFFLCDTIIAVGCKLWISTITKPAPETDAGHEAEFEEIMAEIKQYEIMFDKLHAEVVVLREEGKRKAARGEALQADIERQLEEMRNRRLSHSWTIT